MDNVRETINMISREASPFRTICEVHREIWDHLGKINNPGLAMLIQTLLLEAFDMGKRMDAQLRRYNERWSDGVYSENIDYQEDRTRRKERKINEG